MAEMQDMVVVVGDGPTGLSAGLLLAKNGVGCHVLGMAGTAMDKAMLHNLLGLDGTPGPRFMELARLHAETAGIHLHRQTVTRVERTTDGFVAHTEEGNRFEGRILVLANGRDQDLARSLGCEAEGDRVLVDLDGRTSVDGVYAGGWLTRGHKTQAAISIGDGAAIALDILSSLKGAPFHDFDSLKPSHGRGGPARPDRRGNDRDEHDERTPKVDQRVEDQAQAGSKVRPAGTRPPAQARPAAATPGGREQDVPAARHEG